MNASVQADALTISLVGTMVDVKVVTIFHIRSSVACVQSVCLPLALKSISINGHSLSAINPDFMKVGEFATSIKA